MKTHAPHADTALSEPATAAVGFGEATRATAALGCPRTAQHAALQMRINQSPRMVAQRRTIQALVGSASTTDSDQTHPTAVQTEPRVEVQPNLTGMPNQLKAGIESLSGMDMSSVRVHRNSEKPAQLSALAYAQGNHIHLGPGQEQHLPHEAWHVVQQRQGRVRETAQMAGVGVNDEVGLEREADLMGGRASAGVARRTAESKRQDLTPDILAPDILQLRIDDAETIRRLRAHFGASKADPVMLKLFIEDAIEMTDSLDAAVERVEFQLKREQMVYSPPLPGALDDVGDGGSGLHTRPKIDLERARYQHQSQVPKMATDKEAILVQWRGLKNTANFYGAVRASLKIARDTRHPNNAKETAKLDELINAYEQHPEVKGLIDKYVRVKATKAKGASSGTGLDELFKTSETMKYLERSYRPPPKMAAVAFYGGEAFDWMDAQQQMRLSTEFIVWASDLVGEISGHTGTFQKQFVGKWMTQKQALMHELRDDAISERSNPATAIIEAIGTHLRITANVEQFSQAMYQSGDQADKALLPSGRSLAESHDFLVDQLKMHRDALKRYEKSFKKRAKTVGESSPMEARHGSSSYHPLSPMHGPEDDAMLSEQSGILDNPLPNLANQSRLAYVDPPKPIPTAPVNDAIAFARKNIKQTFGTAKAKSINDAAKRNAKPLMAEEDANQDQVDKMMIEVYLEKVQQLDANAGQQAIVEKLKEGLALLTSGTQ